METQDDQKNIADVVAGLFSADIYFYSGVIDDEAFGKIAILITQNKTADNALLILTY